MNILSLKDKRMIMRDFFLANVITNITKIINIDEKELIKIVYTTKFYQNLMEYIIVEMRGPMLATDFLIKELIDDYGFEINTLNQWFRNNGVDIGEDCEGKEY